VRRNVPLTRAANADLFDGTNGWSPFDWNHGRVKLQTCSAVVTYRRMRRDTLGWDYGAAGMATGNVTTLLTKLCCAMVSCDWGLLARPELSWNCT
jgi:hypothetical protein